MIITKEGWAVLENDTHISEWVKQHGRLDIQEGQLLPWLKNVNEGDLVLDIGACIGDTAATFSKAVGKKGRVWAWEPNPSIYECLKYNADILGNVEAYDYAVGECEGFVDAVSNPNAGASVVKRNDAGKILMVSIDGMLISDDDNLRFIKIDVEGYEPNVLRGGIETIKQYTPDMFIEVNHGALNAAGHCAKDIYEILDSLNYKYEIVSANCFWTSPMFDIYCTYGK